ncbi:MAG: SsrA-binding protein SmpB [Planctomycetota bacterium]|nr:SsrA-binding protein SmpB [Planctomycetota bacterium]MDI6787091.1 SsrA-binding protein SmpB [Planctomycetota bacterium]
MESIKLIQKNRKAYFNYEIIEKYEAGLVLKGTEVKSLRDGQASIAESFARPSRGELFIYQMDISPYKCGPVDSHNPKRPRKLLMRKGEINRLIGKVQERGLTLVPLSLYFKNGLAKIELGLGRGKKLYDKRETIKKRIIRREIERSMRRK